MVLIKHSSKWQRKNWNISELKNIDEYVLNYYLELSSYISTKPLKFTSVPKYSCKFFSETILSSWKKNGSGRYATTYVKDLRVMKIQRIKDKKSLRNLIKEIYVIFFLSQHNLSPKLYEMGIALKLNETIDFFKKDRNGMYIFFIMERVINPFYKLFHTEDIEEYAEKNKRHNFFRSRYWNQFNLALKMYIGGVEMMLKRNIFHNDAHDGNVGFDEEGKIKFFDMGRCRILTKDCDEHKKLDLLYDDLTYFRDMYFFDTKSVNVYAIYEKSHLFFVLEQIENNSYKFGSHIPFLDKKLNIKHIKSNK